MPETQKKTAAQLDAEALEQRKKAPRTHHVYAAGKGTTVSVSGFGVASHDRPCLVPASVAEELARNTKVRVERIAEAAPKTSPAPKTVAKPAAGKGEA